MSFAHFQAEQQHSDIVATVAAERLLFPLPFRRSVISVNAVVPARPSVGLEGADSEVGGVVRGLEGADSEVGGSLGCCVHLCRYWLGTGGPVKTSEVILY